MRLLGEMTVNTKSRVTYEIMHQGRHIGNHSYNITQGKHEHIANDPDISDEEIGKVFIDTRELMTRKMGELR